MKSRMSIAIIIVLAGFADICGQGSGMTGNEMDLRFRGSFRDVPFAEFVQTVEDRTSARFYYLEEWISGIRVTAAGDSLSLRKILTDLLEPVSLSFHIDSDHSVYLVNRPELVTHLPDYNDPPEGIATESASATEAADYTRTEQRYVEGRQAVTLETLEVGDREMEGGGRAVIHGKMTDAETGEPLIGATLYLEELKKGVATDVDGRFSLVVPPGKYQAVFNCMGMEERSVYLRIYSGGNLNVTMEKSLIPITEVVIRADRYHNVRGTQMGFNRLNYQVMKEVPVVMGEKDVLKVIQLLPGVQSVGEGSSGFNVRGSAADQNMIYINKVPVYNSSHLFGFFTSFSPEIVKDFTLYKSNLPASYGGRLASFFDITTRQGNMNKYTARGGISPVTAQLAVEGPLRKEKSAFILTGRSTYSDWILDRLGDPELRESEAAFSDLAGAVTWEPGEKTLVKLFVYRSGDRFALGNTNRYDYRNQGGSAILRRRFSERLTGDFSLAYGGYEYGHQEMSVPPEAYSHNYRIDHYEGRADLTWLSLGPHRLTFGGGAIYYHLDRGDVEPLGASSLRTPVSLGKENGLEAAIYLADEITLMPDLTLYAGIRFAQYLHLGPASVLDYTEGAPLRPGFVDDTLSFRPGEVIQGYFSPEPRVALNYRLDNNQSFKFSYNRLRQFLFMLSNTIAISPTDQWKLVDSHIRPPSVDQLSAGYYRDFPSGGISTSLEVYYKRARDVVDYRDGADFIGTPYVETTVLQGEQKAYGAELLLRKEAGKLNGWFSYAYSRSILQFASGLAGEQINQGRSFPSNYDRPHHLSLVTNYRLNRRLSLSANLVYITGRPATFPVSVYYVDGLEYIRYSGRNSYRIPDYFRVDLSVNLEGNLKERKLFHSFWMLNVYNVTGRKNAYSVFFRNDEGVMNGYRLSIFSRPLITLSWNFKLGNYASE